jgi:hypothetical protein
MAFFESKSGFWLMFVIFLIVAFITIALRIDNIMNYWHQIASFGKKF